MIHTRALRLFGGTVTVSMLLLAASVNGHAGSIDVATVTGQCNIYGAGHASPPSPSGGGGGTLPLGGVIDVAVGDTLIFTHVRGGCYPGYDQLIGPEGFTGSDTAINGYQGISGIKVSGHQMFLAGVFTSDCEPVDPAPAPIDYSGGTGASDYYPQLCQVFFIGDGKTGNGTGACQQFHVPAGATRMYLGFADAYDFVGDPGWYDDNSGQVDFCLTQTPSVLISNLTLDNRSVRGGKQVRGKIRLQNAATSLGGVFLIISANNPTVVPGAMCFIPEGRTEGSFTLPTTRVSRTQKIKVTVRSLNSKTVRLTVTAR